MTINPILKIESLHARIEDGDAILKGLSLEVRPGEVHAVMGPNGAGKSTFANILCGRDGYEITSGSVNWDGSDLFDMEVDERARSGLFLAFQYPVEIPGVTMTTFLKEAVNARRRAVGDTEIDALEFTRSLRAKAKELGVPDDMIKRGVNSGFSGGEKKRAEVLQMAMLEPRFCVLDETDSGLDIDALQEVAKGVNALRCPERSFLVITHYQRLLDYIVPDYVHILANGQIVRSGGPELAAELEANGYAGLQVE